MDHQYIEYSELDDSSLVAQWRAAWRSLESCGGQTSWSSMLAEACIEEIEVELRRRGLRPVFGQCSYSSPDEDCEYGCPDSDPNYWD
jgi:hypothetical protein